MRIGTTEKRQHSVHYGARGRAVKEEPLKHLPPGRLPDGHDGFFYQGYVSAPYLDRQVNELRTAFDIEEEPELSGVSFNEIRSAVQLAVDQYLAPQLDELTRKRDDRVRKIIDKRMPELRYISEQNSEDLARLPLQATDRDLEDEIGQLHLRNQKAGRDLLAGLIQDLDRAATIDLSSFSVAFAARLEQISRPSQANLASYMLFRYSIIEMYRQILKKSGDRFQREAAVHRLLFPLGIGVDTARMWVDHNLWLVDERLAYANFIASDQPLRSHGVLLDVSDRGEPDIAAYFNLSFSSDDPTEGDLLSVVIVELKRPGPLPVREENPWQQVMRYIERIREGFYAPEGGEKIKASDSTRFYCYIVCDLDGDVVRALVNHFQFTRLFDGSDGYFLYNPALKAYVELVPFERLLRDAQRRHRAFFERLGLQRGV